MDYYFRFNNGTYRPLSINGGIENKVSIPIACFIGLLSGAIAGVIVFYWNLGFLQILIFEIFLIGLITASIVFWRFYGDPERIPPEDENAIISPADGKVIYVKKIVKGKIPFSEKKGSKFSLKDLIQTDMIQNGGYLIGIGMNILDVHVNRAPISGKITLLKHIKGAFLSLKIKEAVIQNERVLIVIENEVIKLGTVQIASRLVRRIVPFIREDQEIKRGERIGMIRFGSQVDVIIPHHSTLQIKVIPGEKVKAGTSIIATTKLLKKH